MAHSMMRYGSPMMAGSSRGRRRNRSGEFMNPSEMNPRRRSSRRRSHMNPTRVTKMTYSSQPNGNRGAYDMIMSSLLVGGVAVLTAVGMDMLLGAVLPVTVGAPWRAGIKIGVGLLGGYALNEALKGSDNKWVKTLPAGFAIGGIFSGLSNLYAMYIAPMFMPRTTTQQQVSALPGNGTTPAGTNPAMQVLLPGTYGVAEGYGIPAGYRAWNNQSCGVPQMTY